MQQNPGALFEATFAAASPAVRLINRALQRAYESACENHDPKRGSNESTFGFNLYHFAVHELSEEAERSSEFVTLISRNPIFRLGVVDYELACHRVGTHASQDSDTAFPNNDGDAYTMLQEQLWLPGIERAVGLGRARKIVIAHLGNPDDGLGAIYLCVPGRAHGERIAGWAYTQCIWHADHGAMPEVAVTVAPTVAPDEIIEEAKVRRKQIRKEESEEET